MFFAYPTENTEMVLRNIEIWYTQGKSFGKKIII